jgi:hypothetical protein
MANENEQNEFVRNTRRQLLKNKIPTNERSVYDYQTTKPKQQFRSNRPKIITSTSTLAQARKKSKKCIDDTCDGYFFLIARSVDLSSFFKLVTHQRIYIAFIGGNIVPVWAQNTLSFLQITFIFVAYLSNMRCVECRLDKVTTVVFIENLIDTADSRF